MKHIIEYPTQHQAAVEAYTRKAFAFDDAHARARWAEARKLARELITDRPALELLGCKFSDQDRSRTCFHCFSPTDVTPCSHCGSDNVVHI